VNYVSAALLHIASSNSRLGKAYHLVPPSDAQSIDLIPFFELLGECGYKLNPLPYAQWVNKLDEDSQLDANPLMPLLPMLSEAVYGQLTRWEVYEKMPAYDARNTQDALAEIGGLAFTPMNASLLERYLTHWQQIGFLPQLS
jgi:hypothetical protein